MIQFKVTVELIEPKEEVKRMDISDAGLKKSKEESLENVRQWCFDAIWGSKLERMMAFSRNLGIIPYETNYL